MSFSFLNNYEPYVVYMTMIYIPNCLCNNPPDGIVALNNNLGYKIKMCRKLKTKRFGLGGITPSIRKGTEKEDELKEKHGI